MTEQIAEAREQAAKARQMGKRFRELFVDRSDVTAGFFDSVADTIDALSDRLAQAEQVIEAAQAACRGTAGDGTIRKLSEAVAVFVSGQEEQS